MNATLNRLFAIATILIVAIAVVLAFRVVGPPARARQAAFDQQRVRDLDRLATFVRRRFDRLPARLPTRIVGDFHDHEPIPNDPETHRAYAYQRINATTFRVCAVFDLESDRDASSGEAQRSWNHGAGRTCYAVGFGAKTPYDPVRERR